MQSFLVEILNGIETIKSQNIEDLTRFKWENFYKKYIKYSFDKIVTSSFIQQSSSFLQKISQLVVLWIGAKYVLEGKLTLGQLIAFRIISGYVTQPLLKLPLILQNYQEMKNSLERIDDITTTPKEDYNYAEMKHPNFNGELEFRNVSFKFDNYSKSILENLSFKIKEGQFIAIIGSSGSGKSTLIKLINRIYSPTSGLITINGKDISKLNLSFLRKNVGFVSQEPLLFKGSIASNISLSNQKASFDEILDAARISNCHEFISKLPNEYETIIGEKGNSLSGGQKQRIAIARTLLAKPKLMILDESTSALDYQNEKIILNNINKFVKNTTLIFVTHRLDAIKDADNILFLKRGRVIESGSHNYLIKLKKEYYNLINKN